MAQEYTKGKLNYTLLTNERIRKDLNESFERTIKDWNVELNNIEGD